MSNRKLRFRRFVRLALACAALLLAAGCGSVPAADPAANLPPQPEIKAGETEIPHVQSTFCWKNTCADYPTPDGLLRNSVPSVVAAGSSIRVHYRQGPPPDRIGAALWRDSQTVQQELQDGSFTAPREKGVYYYSVSANWNGRGDSVSAFVIEVK